MSDFNLNYKEFYTAAIQSVMKTRNRAVYEIDYPMSYIEVTKTQDSNKNKILEFKLFVNGAAKCMVGMHLDYLNIENVKLSFVRNLKMDVHELNKTVDLIIG